MYTSLKRPRLGDKVRLTGFLGIFEVVKVRPDGSLVDLKHLDLHETAYIEQEVSAHDLIYVRGPQPSVPLSRPTPVTGSARPNGATPVQSISRQVAATGAAAASQVAKSATAVTSRKAS